MGSVAVADDQLPPSAPPVVSVIDGGRCYQDIDFAQPIGYRPLLMDLHVPVRDEAAPVIVCIYGGGFAMGSHKTDTLGAYLTQRLVAEGFAVARPQYRHSREARFPAQVHDVKAAVRWLRHHAADVGIDPGRIGAWGSSSGGYLATMLAVTGGAARLDGAVGLMGPSSAIQAAVAWSAPVNIAPSTAAGRVTVPQARDRPARLAVRRARRRSPRTC
jgi:acetyl esterase/lipase